MKFQIRWEFVDLKLRQQTHPSTSRRPFYYYMEACHVQEYQQMQLSQIHFFKKRNESCLIQLNYTNANLTGTTWLGFFFSSEVTWSFSLILLIILFLRFFVVIFLFFLMTFQYPAVFYKYMKNIIRLRVFGKRLFPVLWLVWYKLR